MLYGKRAVPPPGDAQLRQRPAGTDVCQPLLGSVQIAATRLLAACGVSPDLTLGHSTGEFAAAAAASALTGEDTVRLLAHRGAALAQAETGARGGMLAVQSDKETCRRLVHRIDDVWFACFNHPRQVVVSGTVQGLAALRRACAAAKVAAVTLEVSNAFHSPRLASAEAAMRADLARRPVTRPPVAFVSCVSAALCSDPAELRELRARHACAPVRFEEAVRSAYTHGARVFLQVTGNRSLLASVRRSLAGHDDIRLAGTDGPAPDSGRGFLQALAHLAVLGAPVDPRALIPHQDRRLLDLPVARLDTQSYWIQQPRRPAMAGRERSLVRPALGPGGRTRNGCGGGAPAGGRPPAGWWGGGGARGKQPPGRGGAGRRP
ncbi:acyltransferase domain-containing protein, partial [Streptomyces avermitilis]|uniref:acyltransferase domain-containing protein n=1 Tax=Streptomyces avermitilis TaxID=33903 RepID=UPI0033CF251E